MHAFKKPFKNLFAILSVALVAGFSMIPNSVKALDIKFYGSVDFDPKDGTVYTECSRQSNMAPAAVGFRIAGNYKCGDILDFDITDFGTNNAMVTSFADQTDLELSIVDAIFKMPIKSQLRVEFFDNYGQPLGVRKFDLNFVGTFAVTGEPNLVPYGDSIGMGGTLAGDLGFVKEIVKRNCGKPDEKQCAELTGNLKPADEQTKILSTPPHYNLLGKLDFLFVDANHQLQLKNAIVSGFKVPEPPSILLLLAGFVALCYHRRTVGNQRGLSLKL